MSGFAIAADQDGKQKILIMMSIDFKREPLSPVLPISFKNLALIFEKAPEEIFKKGEVIFWERQQASYVYFVTRGIVKLSSTCQHKEMLEDYFQKDELLNCGALFGRSADEAMAVAVVPQTTIRKLPVSYLRQIVRSNPDLFEQVLANVSDSLQRTRNRLYRIAMLSARERVYDFLVKHTLKAGRPVGYEYVINPVMTHQEIGHIAGVGRQTVTTVLNELRRQGIIHFTRHYLIVRDLKALQQQQQI